jgi:hemolysin-activating ACP:hemolysin acyltransferase
MKILHRGFEIHWPTAHQAIAWSAWEVAGMAAWLWSRSGLHRSWDLRLFEQDVLESIELQQFVLMLRDKQPAGYLSWGHLSDEAELSYLVDPHSLRREDKRSGPHLWMFNWTAPHGGSGIFIDVARRHLFHSSVGHMLRVKPGGQDLGRIVSNRGAQVLRPDYAREVLRMHGTFERAQQLRAGLAPKPISGPT